MQEVPWCLSAHARRDDRWPIIVVTTDFHAVLAGTGLAQPAQGNVEAARVCTINWSGSTNPPGPALATPVACESRRMHWPLAGLQWPLLAIIRMHHRTARI